MRRALVLLGVLLLAGSTRAGPGFRDLDANTRHEVAAAASAYLDPELEFLWRPRKDLLKTLEALQASYGIHALADIPFLRQVVYEGRHFLSRFSDRTWQRENDITVFEKDGPYRHVVAERHRFSYALPKRYPDERTLAKIPHPDPFPLLLSIHEEQDTRTTNGEAEPFPGGAALERRFPKEGFEDLYDGWLLLAPVAVRARFLDEGAIRHRYLTSVLTNFWRRYHVDFDRIVVDGGAPAAALAAAFPQVFAGVVLRPGAQVDLDAVVNWATVPVLVVDDEDLAHDLERHGHPAVSRGDDAALLAWLDARRRATATSFRWRWLRPDHANANWIVITGPDRTAPEQTLAVQALDTEDDPNTIRIDAAGIDALELFLNDEIVDLDRPVRLVVNGEARDLGVLERDFDRLFEKDPEIRRNMNFGWLYTTMVDDVRIAGSPAPPDPTPRPERPGSDVAAEAKAALLWEKAQAAERDGEEARARIYFLKIVELGPTSWRARAEARIRALDGTDPDPWVDPVPQTAPDAPPRVLTELERLGAQQAWLEGRPDEIEEHLGPGGDAVTAVHLLPFALRDLWWRPAESVGLSVRCERALETTPPGTLADQLRWILAGGGGDPYPRFQEPSADPWPVLTALVLERRMRETTGAAWLPDESPVLRRKVLQAPAEWQDWYARWCTWFYGDVMRIAYDGEGPDDLPEALRTADAEEAALAAATRTRNLWLAVLTGVLFVGGVLVLGKRASRA